MTASTPATACLIAEIERIAFTPDSAARAVDRTRTRIFAAIRKGELAAFKDGKATLIEREELVRWIKTFPIVSRRSEAGRNEPRQVLLGQIRGGSLSDDAELTVSAEQAAAALHRVR